MGELNPSSQLEAGIVTTIATLNSELENVSTRVVKGVVTIVWPYSAFKGTTAFILAEADFRLRRDQGQVRVELSGPGAKAFSESGIASGDEVTLSLDGVAWAEKDARTPITGTPLPWQLKFKQRLLLQAVEGQNTKTVDVNEQAAPELQEPILPLLPEPIEHHTPPRDPTPEKHVPTKRPADAALDPTEFASPAFIKRARMSYGSLFEGGLDIFDEDIANAGRAKKRAKTGRFSMSWRYASQTPSPEPDESEDLEQQAESTEAPAEEATPSRSNQMVDGGCQTDNLGTTPPSHVDVIAEPRRYHFEVDGTPSKAPPSMGFDVQHQAPTSGFGVGFMFGTAHPQPVDGFLGHGHPPDGQPLQTSYAPVAYDPSNHDAHHLHAPEHPSLPAQVAAHDSFHTTPDSYHSPHPHHDVLPTEAYYPPIDGHQQDTVSSLPPQTSSHQDTHYGQGETTHLQVHHEESQYKQPHHTMYLDRIAEPQQSPWRFAANTTEAAIPGGGNEQSNAIEILSSSPPRPVMSQEGRDADDDTSVLPDGEFATHAEQRRGRDDALRVEEDEDAEENDGVEELYGARSYGERHMNAERSSQTAAAGEASDKGDASDASGDDEMRDAGGDYDISHYSNLSHIQDDDNASQLESDYGQEDENAVYDSQVEGNEDDEIDEDVENFDDGSDEEGYERGYHRHEEEEEEYDEEEVDLEEEEEWEEDEAPQPPRQAAPQVISLLSDSEDDDDAPAPQPRIAPPPMQPNRRSLPQYDGSNDEADSASDSEADSDVSGESGPNVMTLEEEARDIQTEGHVQIPGHADSSADNKSSPATQKPEVVSPTVNPEGSITSRSQEAAKSPVELKPAEAEQEIAEERPAQAPMQSQLEVDESSTIVPPPVHTEQPESASNIQDQKAEELEKATETQASTTTTVEETPISQTGLQEITNQTTSNEPILENALKHEEMISSEPLKSHDDAAKEMEAPPGAMDVEMAGQVDDATTEPTEATEEVPTPSESRARSPEELTSQQNAAEPVPAISFDFQTGATENAGAAPASPPATQTGVPEMSPEPAVKEAPKQEDVEMEDAEALPTPKETQDQEEDYSQDDVDLQLAQEAAESTRQNSPRPEEAQSTTDKPTTTESVKADAAEEESSPPKASSPQVSETPSTVLDGENRDESSPPTKRFQRAQARDKKKSEQDGGDPSVKLARSAIASRRSTRLQDQVSPDNVRVTRAASHNFQRSASPDEEVDQSLLLARAALQSPSRNKEGDSTKLIKVQLQQSLRQDVPDCITLKVLRHHPNKTVDVIAIVATEPPEPKRAKGGPRGIMLSFNVTDHSIAPANVTLVHIFRANKSALPLVKPGDAILLRQFTITAMTGRGFGLRANDASSWAAFDGEGEDEVPQIRGPPVELSKGDKTYGVLLKRWYRELDEPTMARLRKTNEKALGSEGAK